MSKPPIISPDTGVSFGASVLPGDESVRSFSDNVDTLAIRLYPHSRAMCKAVKSAVQKIYTDTQGKDFLVIHSPGGWGNSVWEDVQPWEKSIVTGVTSTLENLHYSYVVKQHFRGGIGWFGRNWVSELQFFFGGDPYSSQVLAEELKLILQERTGLRVILVGASRGAAFDNAVMKQIDSTRVFSFELGTFFTYVKHRKITDRNLAIDNNGIVRDPISQRDLWAGFKAFMKAYYFWLKYRFEGHPVKFANCINAPGHDYKWTYPAVGGKITEYLTNRFGTKK